MIRILKFMLGVFCIVVIALSCSHSSNTMDTRLYRADSLANKGKADYAMSMLGGVDYENLNEWNRHYYDLLMVKVSDKINLEYESDSLILDVISYFEHTNSYAELTAAFYYGGRVYSVMGNTPQALDMYRKAYNRLDDSPSSLKGRIAYEMGRINLDLYQLVDAKLKFSEAVGFHETMGDTIELINSYCLLGETFLQMGENDSALVCMNQAERIANLSEPYGKEYVGVGSQKANFHLSNGDVDAAVAVYDLMLPYLSRDNTTDYSIIAGINVYMAKGNWNVAEMFAKRLVSSPEIHHVEIAYSALLDIARRKKDMDNVAHYSVKYKSCVDSINKLYVEESSKLRNTLYNYSIRAEEHELDSDKRDRQRYISICIALLACVLVLCVMMWGYRRHRRLQEQSIIQLKRIEELMASKVELASTPEDLSPAEQLQMRFQEIISNVNPKDIKVANEVLDSEVYAKLKECVYSDMEIKPTDDDWQQLDEVVNKAYPEFKNKLYALSKLSDYEYNVCLLVKCKFSPSEMAALTFHSKTSIASTRSRLCGKFFCYNGVASDCDKFLLSL